MRFASYLKRVGDLLDSADHETTHGDLDLQSLTGKTLEAAGGALGAAKEGAAGQLKDLGLAEGLNEWTSQIRGDLAGGANASGVVGALAGDGDGGSFDAAAKLLTASASSAPELVEENGSPKKEVSSTPAISGLAAEERETVEERRLADLREHLLELETRERERQEAMKRLQSRYVETEEEIKRLRELAADTSDKDLAKEPANAGSIRRAASQPECSADDERVEAEKLRAAMQKEFFEQHAAAEERRARLEAELNGLRADGEPVETECEFWREKVQRVLASRGLSEVPRDLRRSVERRLATGAAVDTSQQQSITACAPENESDSRRQSDTDVRRNELQDDLSAQQEAYAEAERRLDLVMRDSEAAMSCVEDWRRRLRDLEVDAASADAAAIAASEAAEAAERRLEAAREQLHEAQRIRAVDRHAVEAARNAALGAQDAASQAVATEVAAERKKLREEFERLTCTKQRLKEENAGLELRLSASRATAVANLERAVPRRAATFWQAIDVPVLKVATHLVRSTCMQRFFLAHLIATYCWLFLLIFWLEHRHLHPLQAHAHH